MSVRPESRQPAARGGSEPKLIQSVERALMMLEEVATSPRPLSAAEVARRAGVNRGTAWRLLATLEHFHLVERSPDSRSYTLGYALARMAAVSPGGPLARRAHPVLSRLAAELDECVYLMVASGADLVVLDEVRGTRPVHVDLAQLDPPLHCGSVGKAFLAHLPDDEVEEYLSRPLEAFTSRTVVDPDRLREELGRARSDGYAVAYQEHLPDWAGISAAACDPSGRPLAYLNVTVQTFRYTEAQLRDLAAPLLRARHDLQQRLALRPDSRTHHDAREIVTDGSTQ